MRERESDRPRKRKKEKRKKKREKREKKRKREEKESFLLSSAISNTWDQVVLFEMDIVVREDWRQISILDIC